MFHFKYSFYTFFCILYVPTLCITEDLKMNINDLTGPDVSEYPNIINLILYKRSSVGNAEMYKLTLNEVSQFKDHIDFQLPTTIFIHGYKDSYEKNIVKSVVFAYLENKKGGNILALDWSELSGKNYFYLVAHTKNISNSTGKALDKLVKMGLNPKKLHIIGHSMGGQIAGFIGRYINFKIPRITALDPANPGFYQLDADHIDRNSADQVVVIHTDGGDYGAFRDTGHIDFYANGGSRPQPGCSIADSCSHHRCWQFYVESLYEKNAFPAVKCESYMHFIVNKCHSDEVLYFGYDNLPNATGRYYFNTNSKSPFSMKEAGTKDKTFIEKFINKLSNNH